VRVCDIAGSEPYQVTEAILMPILDHLAARLAFMDRDAVAWVLKDLDDVAAGVTSLSRDLERQFGSWQANLPDEEIQRRDRFRKLKNQVGRELEKVRDEYDRLHASGQPIAELHQQIETAGEEIRQWLAASLGSGSREKWVDSFQDAIAGRNMGDELDRQYNSSRKFVVKVFGEIDASLERAIKRLHGEVAAALRGKLTEKVVPTGSDHGAVLSAFAASIEADARTLSAATRRLLELRADYGSIFLRVGRPLVRRIDWYRDQSQATTGDRLKDAAGRVAEAAGQAAPGAAGLAANVAASHLAGPMAGQAAGATARKVVSSAMHQGGSQQPSGTSWLSDHLGGAPAQSSYMPPPKSADTSTPGLAQPVGQSPGPGAESVPLSDADYWYDKLTERIKSVTAELTTKFHDEAQRTLEVIAAAVDLYKDSATTVPGIEVEYERICLEVQQDIWPEEFGEASAKITADIAALRKQAHHTEAAADQVAVLAGQVTKL
jgi:hypothetical protein